MMFLEACTLLHDGSGGLYITLCIRVVAAQSRRDHFAAPRPVPARSGMPSQGGGYSDRKEDALKAEDEEEEEEVEQDDEQDDEHDDEQLAQNLQRKPAAAEVQQVEKAGGEDNSKEAAQSQEDGKETAVDEKPGVEKPEVEKPGGERPGDEKQADEKPGDEKPRDEKPEVERPAIDKKPDTDEVVSNKDAGFGLRKRDLEELQQKVKEELKQERESERAKSIACPKAAPPPKKVKIEPVSITGPKASPPPKTKAEAPTTADAPKVKAAAAKTKADAPKVKAAAAMTKAVAPEPAGPPKRKPESEERLLRKAMRRKFENSLAEPKGKARSFEQGNDNRCPSHLKDSVIKNREGYFENYFSNGGNWRNITNSKKAEEEELEESGGERGWLFKEDMIKRFGDKRAAKQMRKLKSKGLWRKCPDMSSDESDCEQLGWLASQIQTQNNRNFEL